MSKLLLITAIVATLFLCTVNCESSFNLDTDTLAFLHIQKTSGSYWLRHLLNHLMVNAPHWIHACLPKTEHGYYECLSNRAQRPFFWHQYVNHNMDIHADYTQSLNTISRVTKGKVFLITMLRDPIERYVSEFQEVRRGATWHGAINLCKEQFIYQIKCYSPPNWSNVQWGEFAACKNNLANNRQTRMLANYNELGCDVLRCMSVNTDCTVEETHKMEDTLLGSAKKTLLEMEFFGLVENQTQSEYLFEQVFENKFKFSKSHGAAAAAEQLKTSSNLLLEKYLYPFRKQIEENNRLDLELYRFATEIFIKRLNYYKEKHR